MHRFRSNSSETISKVIYVLFNAIKKFLKILSKRYYLTESRTGVVPSKKVEQRTSSCYEVGVIPESLVSIDRLYKATYDIDGAKKEPRLVQRADAAVPIIVVSYTLYYHPLRPPIIQGARHSVIRSLFQNLLYFFEISFYRMISRKNVNSKM